MSFKVMNNEFNKKMLRNDNQHIYYDIRIDNQSTPLNSPLQLQQPLLINKLIKF